jgi:V/A-type H+-transporting ATPase subunit I
VTVRKLIKVLVVGASDAHRAAEDALTALKCMDVTNVERGAHHFLVEGWLPQLWFEELRFILEEGTGGRVTVLWDESVDPAVTLAPVSLENPRVARPFETFVELFSLPGREGYDPTFLTFLILPIFFGFVIGDYGYGIVFVLAGWYVRRRFRTPVAELASTLTIAGGIWSIVFGLLVYAEFFAFHTEVGPLSLHLIDRLEDVPQLLLLSIGFGLVHLTLGLVIGFQFERRRAGLRAAFLRKFSWIVLEVGFVLLGVGVLGFVAGPVWIPAVAIIAFAVTLISFGGGIVDVVEVPAFVGNIFSYLRLGILGIAESVLGLALNTIVTEGLLQQGILGWVVGAAVFIVGHGFVMALLLLTVSIHSLRLHYVEFYTKFYPLEEIGVPRPFEPVARPGARAGEV